MDLGQDVPDLEHAENSSGNQDQPKENKDWDEWAHQVDLNVMRLNDTVQMHIEKIQEVRQSLDRESWTSWFQETLRSSAEVKSFVGGMVSQKMATCGDQLKTTLDEGKIYIDKIVAETKEYFREIIHGEVTRQVDEVRQDLVREIQTLRGHVDD